MLALLNTEKQAARAESRTQVQNFKVTESITFSLKPRRKEHIISSDCLGDLFLKPAKPHPLGIKPD